jgi:hypothetical protein
MKTKAGGSGEDDFATLQCTMTMLSLPHEHPTDEKVLSFGVCWWSAGACGGGELRSKHSFHLLLGHGVCQHHVAGNERGEHVPGRR